MPAQIEKAYINAFNKGFAQAFQQTNSRLRPFVEIESQTAEFEYYDRIGVADDMTEVTTRYGDNPVSDISHERRRIALRDYEIGKPVDEKDLIRVAMDPSSSYMQALVATANRKVDDVIIAGLTATTFAGKAGATTIAFSTSTADKITVGAISDVATRITTGTVLLREAATEGINVNKTYNGATAGGSATGLTLAKLKGIRETMMKLDAIEQDQVIDMFIAAHQFQDLLALNEVIDIDYSTRKNLAEGNVTTFAGFRFHHCERLPYASSTRTCFAFLPQAFKLAIAKDIKADMWRLPEKKNIPYLYVNLSMGGSRMWGEVLARVECAE